MTSNGPPAFVSLGMFIIDDFEFTDENGVPTGQHVEPQIGGGGIYAAIGARIWLPANQVGVIVDKGCDFPADIQERLLNYGKDMWLFRDQPDHLTTRSLNSYRGEFRGFEYKTPRIRITPRDLTNTCLDKPRYLHFICSPSRALSIVSEIDLVSDWRPKTVYEPIPDRPNADEALSLLGRAGPPSKESVEWAADQFLTMGIGQGGKGWVLIRSGSLGVYVKTLAQRGIWIEAFWTEHDKEKIVDVTGAGNSFLGGLAAGLVHSDDDMYEAAFYATVSASYTIEQQSLPIMTSQDPEMWNNDRPQDRLAVLKRRHQEKHKDNTV